MVYTGYSESYLSEGGTSLFIFHDSASVSVVCGNYYYFYETIG
jgi:hypothetical protein